ncbi:MAG: sensor histidine kinase, partial [Deltaproteobacteria bacterium]
MKPWIQKLRPGARSLKTQLAIYFIPVALLPAVGVSFYALQAFEKSNQETLARRASSEREAIVSEFEANEKEFLEQARVHAHGYPLIRSLSENDLLKANTYLNSFKNNRKVRIYNSEGTFWTRRNRDVVDSQIPYISKEGLKRVRGFSETVDRYFSSEDKAIITVVRILIKDKDRVYGILEEESTLGFKELNQIKNKRGVEVLFLSRDLISMAGSFALSKDEISRMAKEAFKEPERGQWAGSITPGYVSAGDTRFAAFLYDMPGVFGKMKYWGYLGVFVSMSAMDTVTSELKRSLIYVTLFVVLAFATWIFIFANRIVEPVEKLVLAMKRIKSGRVEEIPALESPYEIQYLIHAFNDMGRNVISAKKALEQKVEELGKANQEIKNAQTQMVHSAKMISLGQIVAGVAHELNNPIGSIHSNMQSLENYIERIRKLVEEYHGLRDQLTPAEREQWIKKEKELDIDFILNDIGELTKSCIDGARRTRDIVLGLRTFSRMDSGGLRQENIHDGILSTLKLLAPQFKNRITVHQELGEIPEVECNLQQLNQVFVNLLSNAAQAISGKGDIWIRTRLIPRAVQIEIE